jgi:hypothetical protein
MNVHTEAVGADPVDHEEAILSTAYGVGWASASFSELLAPEHRPALAIGVIGTLISDPDHHHCSISVSIATPFIGAAQLQGQLEALRAALPAELHATWDEEQAKARTFAAERLPGLRDRFEPHD